MVEERTMGPFVLGLVGNKKNKKLNYKLKKILECGFDKS